MKSNKKFVILSLILIYNFFNCNLALSEQMRNPFKDWFPREVKKTSEEVIVQEPIVSFEFEEEEFFDPTIYNVEGLIWGTPKPKAIIDDAIYNLGDYLDDAEIVGISKEGVTLVFDDTEYTISTKQTLDASNDLADVLNDSVVEEIESDSEAEMEIGMDDIEDPGAFGKESSPSIDDDQGPI